MRFVVGGSMTEPVKLAGADPLYPEAARRARVQGVVVLELTINTKGHVTHILPLRPLPLGLTEAAVASVRDWRFQPAMLNDRLVTSNYIITVRFLLDGSPAVAAESARPALQPETTETAASNATVESAAVTTDQASEIADPQVETAAALRPAISHHPPGIVAGQVPVSTGGHFGPPPLSVAILAPSLVLLIFATGAWLAQRRVTAQ